MINKIKELPFKSYNPSYEFLAFFRIFFSVFLLWNGLPNSSWVAELPESAMHPPISLLSFISFIPPGWFFILCGYTMIACLLLILIGFKPRIFAILYVILLIITDNYAFSFGKINHSFIYILPILVMSFSPWNKTFSFFKEPIKETDTLAKSWPMFLISFIFSFGMFTAAHAKYTGGWFHHDLQSSQIFFYQYRFALEWDDLLSDTFDSIKSQVFWEIMDHATVIFEAAFIVSILKPKCFRFMIYLATIFHLGVLLMMNISFTISVGLYALFIPTELLPSKLKLWIKKITGFIFKPQHKIIGIVFVVLYFTLIILFDFSFFSFLFNKLLELAPINSTYKSSLIILGLAFLVGTYLFIRSLVKGKATTLSK